MKVKLAILGLVLLCLWGRPAYADTIVDIVATFCPNCPGHPLPVDFQAQVTVMPVAGDPSSFGAFFNPIVNGFYNGPVLEVTGISGTFNGNPISFMQAPFGDGSWLYPDLFIGALYFSGASCPCSMFWDGGFGPTITFTEFFDNNQTFGSGSTPVNYSATVNTPEPGTLGLFGLGFLFLCCRLKARGRITGLRHRFPSF
jgi:hypothetical protein